MLATTYESYRVKRVAQLNRLTFVHPKGKIAYDGIQRAFRKARFAASHEANRTRDLGAEISSYAGFCAERRAV